MVESTITTPNMEGTTVYSTTTGNSTTQTAAAAPSGAEERTFTQEEVNKMIDSRIKRERSKYAGFEELKAKAEQADARADYDDIKAERDRLTQEIAHRDLLDKVVSETGVPRGLIHGDTEEEMRASAKAVVDYVETFKPQHPTDKGGAASPKPTTHASIDEMPRNTAQQRMDRLMERARLIEQENRG